MYLFVLSCSSHSLLCIVTCVLVRLFSLSLALSFAPYNCKLFFGTYRVSTKGGSMIERMRKSRRSGIRFFLLCERVTLVAIHRSALHRHPRVSLGLSPRTIVSLSRSYLWLLTVAVNNYLMCYSPYTLRLMVYVTESILHAKFLFPKIGKSAVLCSSFCPLFVGLSSTSS